MNRSNYQAAMTAPDYHQLTPGVGFVELGPLDMPTTGQPGNCSASADAPDGSRHLLQSPHGGDPIEFIWNKDKGLWVRIDPTSKRLAYRPDYLSRNGWAYVGAI